MFRIYTIKDHKAWDEKVVSFPNHDIYYLSGYLKAFEIHGDGEPILVYYESEGVRGICAYMLRDLVDEKWTEDLQNGDLRDVVTPYGYGGWLMDGDCSEEKLNGFWKEYEAFMKEQKIVCAFTRWCPWLKNQETMRGHSNIIDLGNTIFIDTTTVDGIMENIKSKDRSTIRKAVKNDITVELSDDPSLFNEFIEIYNGTMLKDNAEEYYFFKQEFYESIINDLKGKWLMATARWEDKIIAMSIMLFCNGRVHYHLSILVVVWALVRIRCISLRRVLIRMETCNSLSLRICLTRMHMISSLQCARQMIVNLQRPDSSLVIEQL